MNALFWTGVEMTPEPWQLSPLTTAALPAGKGAGTLLSLTPSLCVAGAATAVGGLSRRIHSNARRHDNHLQLCRVQKMMRGQKIKVLTEGRLPLTPRSSFFFSDSVVGFVSPSLREVVHPRGLVKRGPP